MSTIIQSRGVPAGRRGRPAAPRRRPDPGTAAATRGDPALRPVHRPGRGPPHPAGLLAQPQAAGRGGRTAVEELARPGDRRWRLNSDVPPRATAVFGSPDVHRAGTRRILACPYCHGLQAVPPQPVQVVIFAIGCRKCHRVFRITEAGAAPASDRADEGIITPRRRPGRVFIDRRVEPAEGGSKQAPARSTGNRLMMGMHARELRSTAIALLALAAAAAAMYVLLAVLDSTHTAVRRRRPGQHDDGRACRR